jgi:D-glycero-alpha-D-manno-heptose-7-phosphate kinase
MIISKTPLRVSFFGGGTDLPEFYRNYKGAVIGTAIDKYIYHSVFNFPSKLFSYNTRLSYSKVECVNKIDEIQHAPYREILKANNIHGDVEMNVASDLPSFSGLGTSSAFSVGLIKALNAFNGRHISQENLAKEAIRIEREILHEAVGCQDQIFAAFGGFNIIQFRQDDSFDVERVSISKSKMSELSESLVLFFTGITRRAHNVEAEKIKNIASIDESLKKIYGLVEKSNNILTSNQSLIEFGKLLDETWQDKKKLSNGITNETIDTIYQRAMSNGAVGGKLLGAGGGGFLLFFVPPEKKEKLRAAMSDLHEINFQMNAFGSTIIHA